MQKECYADAFSLVENLQFLQNESAYEILATEMEAYYNNITPSLEDKEGNTLKLTFSSEAKEKEFYETLLKVYEAITPKQDAKYLHYCLNAINILGELLNDLNSKKNKFDLHLDSDEGNNLEERIKTLKFRLHVFYVKCLISKDQTNNIIDEDSISKILFNAFNFSLTPDVKFYEAVAIIVANLESLKKENKALNKNQEKLDEALAKCHSNGNSKLSSEEITTVALLKEKELSELKVVTKAKQELIEKYVTEIKNQRDQLAKLKKENTELQESLKATQKLQ